MLAVEYDYYGDFKSFVAKELIPYAAATESADEVDAPGTAARPATNTGG
jgi:hypothetical protein